MAPSRGVSGATEGRGSPGDCRPDPTDSNSAAGLRPSQQWVLIPLPAGSVASRGTRVGRFRCPTLGNTYSGSSPMGLTAILDVAKPGDKILMTSFGSGAGSDGFVFEATDAITKVQDAAPKTRDQLDRAVYIEYGEYAKFRGKIRMGE